MCGYAGEFVFNGRADVDVATRMANRLGHRGPDEARSFLSPDGQCAMAFRRLSIIDLQKSHQPMTCKGDSLAMVFNGEIYNYRHLRNNIAGMWDFKTAGDSEALLANFVIYGNDCFEKLFGMFSACFYDSSKKTLTLVRDRIGQKPLFYCILSDRIIFASELKAVLQHPKIEKQPDYFNITSYLTIGYVQGPNTAYKGIHRIPPANFASISADGKLKTTKYWDPVNTHIALPDDEDLVIDMVRQRIMSAVGMQLEADVPLGVLLSGGIDSAVITAAMCEHRSAVEVQTFTAGFSDAQYDERSDAQLTAGYFGTQHTEVTITPDPNGMFDWVVDHYDEPFGDSSALPTYLICQAAKKHVTVALGGDGGDEIFGGYDRYRAMYLSQHAGAAKYLAYRIAGGIADVIAPHNERNQLRRIARFTQALQYPPSVQYFTYRRLFGPLELLRLLEPSFLEEHEIYVDDPAEWFCDLFEEGPFEENAINAQLHDLRSYLPDDTLVKTDIASMATSLELRAPLLDHELVELGLSLPVGMKITKHHGKEILQRAFGDILPSEVFAKPKRGFGIPLGTWLRKQLCQDMLSTLTSKKFQEFGIFEPNALAGLVNDHLTEKADHSHRLWAITVLAKWLIKNF